MAARLWTCAWQQIQIIHMFLHNENNINDSKSPPQQPKPQEEQLLSAVSSRFGSLVSVHGVEGRGQLACATRPELCGAEWSVGRPKDRADHALVGVPSESGTDLPAHTTQSVQSSQPQPGTPETKNESR
eukprot:g65072.t1